MHSHLQAQGGHIPASSSRSSNSSLLSAQLQMQQRWLDRHPSCNAARSQPGVAAAAQENAGNMSFRLPFLRGMIERLNCPVFAVRWVGAW